MIQVQVFDEEHEDDLSDAINAFLWEHPQIDVVDIKFSTAIVCDAEEQIYCFSAMLIYRDKKDDGCTY